MSTIENSQLQILNNGLTKLSGSSGSSGSSETTSGGMGSTSTSGLKGSGAGSMHIRRDPNSRNQDHHDVVLTAEQEHNAVSGLVIYVLVFIIGIPVILYKFGFHEFLKLYFVNTDLIATVISFDKGPFKNIFKYLYNDTGPLIGFISQSVINWSVLFGLFYIMLSEGKNKRITEGLSKIAFILVITYLLPGRFIVGWMEDFYQFLVGNFKNNGIDEGLITMVIGLIFATGFILVEMLSIEHLSPHLKIWMDKFLRIV